MKSKKLDLLSMLRVERDEGRIFLHNKRVLVVNADALGTLRKDLILSLGQERAKGFLLRYGWACGYHDALDMRDRFDWASDREWFLMAPVVHTLEGAVRVKVTHSSFDREAGRFHVEGEWSHSYEAEQHLRHFGLSREPVCWTLAGYAGGWGTAYLGRRVVYRETECVARGDPVCRFVARTADEWGPEIASELAYYDEARVRDELDEAYRQIRLHNDLLQKTAAIHEDLTRLVLEGKDIPEITESLARVLGQPVVVEDAGHQIVSAAPPGAVPEALAPGRTGPVGLARRSPALTRETRLLQAQRRYTAMPPLPDLETGRPWLATPIVAGERVLGYVSLLPKAGEPGELEAMVLERAALVYALQLLTAQAVAEVEQRILGDLLQSLLTGDFTDEDRLVRRARHFGLDLTAEHRVLVTALPLAQPSPTGHPADEARLEEERHRGLDVARAWCQRVAPGSTAAVKGDHLVLVCRSADRAPRELATGLAQELQAAWPREGVRVGAGGPCRSPREFPASYMQARLALGILTALGGTDSSERPAVLVYEELGPYASLVRPHDLEEARNWARQRLAPLMDHDQRKGGELLHTLEVLVQNDWSLGRTARAAALHLSGLKYRLKKIEALLGVDLGRAGVRFELQLALLIERLSQLSVMDTHGRQNTIR